MPSASDVDRAVFGAKKKVSPVPANDPHDTGFEIEVDSEEATHLVERASSDRRKKGGERRRSDERRGKSDYAPLPKVDRGYRTADDGKRGPLLLVGALLIVAVFSVVVWNAYREGVRPEDSIETVPELASAGAFKTPPRELSEAKVAAAPDAEVLEQLEGPPSVAIAPQDVREQSPAVKAPAASVAPPAVKIVPPVLPTAPPPSPLKQPVAATVVAKPPIAKPPTVKPDAAISLTPAPSQAVATKPAAPAPAPASVIAPVVAPVAAPVTADSYKPVFSPSGSHVVQIAAPSTEAGAIAEWSKRAKASPELFSAAERFIVQADVNGKTVYRLRAGPFASKVDADAFCSAFKAKGGNCFPAAK